MAWTAENRKIASERARARLTPQFRALLSARQKSRWVSRKCTLNAFAIIRSAEEILLSRPLWNSHFDWTAQERADLAVLCQFGATLKESADALGRSPQAILDKARSLKLTIPTPWNIAFYKPKITLLSSDERKLSMRQMINAERARLAKIRQDEYDTWKKTKLAEIAQIGAQQKILKARERAKRDAEIRISRAPLQFPYVANARAEHNDLLAVNRLVPRGMPEWIRADICQNIMVAIFEGNASIEELQKNRDKISWFIRKFYREQMPREEISLESNDDDRDSLDIAAHLSYRGESLNEMRLTKEAVMRVYHRPTQERDVYLGELAELAFESHKNGSHLSFDELEEMMENS